MAPAAKDRACPKKKRGAGFGGACFFLTTFCRGGEVRECERGAARTKTEIAGT